MINKLFTTMAAISFLGCGTARAQPEDSHPSIIVLIIDDMGRQDTSVLFWYQETRYNEMYDTPNMERLASQGMMFTQAYACPVSSPTRCSLMAGMNMAHHRVTNWTLQRDMMTDAGNDSMKPADQNCNNIAQVPTAVHATTTKSFVQLLKDSGYHTIHHGGAHWGAIDTPGENPCHFDFEINIMGTAAGGLATYLSELDYGHTKDGKPYTLSTIPGLQACWGTGTSTMEALTKKALKTSDKAKRYKQPFYLYMSHYAVYVPIDKDMRFFPKYARRGLSNKDTTYASLAEGIDKSLGDIMDWLEKNKEADSTIIIFLGNNGGLTSSQQWYDGPLYTQNAPLKSEEGSLYEGGIRVPFIMKWNDVVKAGVRSDASIMVEDLYPTILRMARITRCQVLQAIDGMNLVPSLQGRTDKALQYRAIVWNIPNVWDGSRPGISLNCAIRQGDWKLIYDYLTGREELYHVSSDIGEKENMVEQSPQRVKGLSVLLGRKLHDMNAQRPMLIRTGEPYKWPDKE